MFNTEHSASSYTPLENLRTSQADDVSAHFDDVIDSDAPAAATLLTSEADEIDKSDDESLSAVQPPVRMYTIYARRFQWHECHISVLLRISYTGDNVLEQISQQLEQQGLHVIMGNSALNF